MQDLVEPILLADLSKKMNGVIQNEQLFEELDLVKSQIKPCDNDNLNDYCARIMEIWKHEINLEWTPCSKINQHKCLYTSIIDEQNQINRRESNTNHFVKEKIGRVRNKKSKTDINFMGCRIDHIPFSVYNRPGGLHYCIRNYCKLKHRTENAIFTFDHLYACHLYAIPHLCGKLCDKMELNKEHMYVCPLTGLSFGTVEITNAHPFSIPYNSSDIIHKIDQNAVQFGTNIDDVNLQSGRGELVIEKSKNNKKNTTDVVVQFRTKAQFRIWNMLSEERFVREREKHEPEYTNINYQIDRYITKMGQEIKNTGEGFFDIGKICTIGEAVIRKKYDFPLVSLTVDTQKKLMRDFAERCLKLWVIIRTMTKLGREKPNLFQWPEFIDVSMYMFQAGYKIPKGKKMDYDIEIIEPNELLATIPLDITDRADRANFINGDPKTNCINKMKKNLYNALTDAIIKEKVAPELLRPENVDFDQIDKTIFINNGLGYIAPKKCNPGKKRKIQQKVEGQQKDKRRKVQQQLP